jgi:uncharacterized protein YcbX
MLFPVPNVTFEAGRFRPNLGIEAPGGQTGFIENDWVERTVAIGGEVRLCITDPTPRCLIPTQAQHGGIAKNSKVVRAILEHNKLPVPLLDNEVLPCVGVYGFVIRGGMVREGDRVRVE